MSITSSVMRGGVSLQGKRRTDRTDRGCRCSRRGGRTCRRGCRLTSVACRPATSTAGSIPFNGSFPNERHSGHKSAVRLQITPVTGRLQRFSHPDDVSTSVSVRLCLTSGLDEARTTRKVGWGSGRCVPSGRVDNSVWKGPHGACCTPPSGQGRRTSERVAPTCDYLRRSQLIRR